LAVSRQKGQPVPHPDPSATDDAALELPTEAAFTELLPEMSAVPDDQLTALNVDVVEVVTLVLGVLPKLRALRPEIQQLPFFDLARFDRLEKYALALNHAHTRYRSTLPSRGNVAELGKELALVRDRLYSNAMSLADFGLLDGNLLKDCKTVTGYRAKVTDVFTLVAVFKQSWSQVMGKTPVTLEALSDAGTRAENVDPTGDMRRSLSEVVSEDGAGLPVNELLSN
jgi:hypothetical protein